MISVLGTTALIAAAVLGTGGALAWVTTARRGVAIGQGGHNGVNGAPAPDGQADPVDAASRVARWCTAGGWFAAAVAVGLMEWALLSHDFSVAFVAETGSRDLPLYYTITALWAGAGGSLILWLFVLATFTAAAARWRAAPRPASHAVTMAVLTGLVAVFALLTQLGAEPFGRVAAAAANGPGPNPLLQDHPAMGIHPPLLYAGFAGLAVPFAMSVAALAVGRVDGRWAQSVRSWVLAAWIFLTAGVALGAWWSYAVLGWGGYWAWDPVENISLMPWLLATALLHVLRTSRRGPGWAAAAVTLAGAAFMLVILGTLLTRSGALLSVHSFSDSPLGLPLLVLFGSMVAGWAVLLMARRDRLGTAPSEPGPLLSRQTALRGQAALLILITVTIFAGTVLPVLVETATGNRLSVGAPWFNLTTGPPALAVLVLMAVGPLIAWDDDTPAALLVRLRWPGVAALLTVGIVGLTGTGGLLLPITAGLAVFVVVSLVQQLAASANRRRVGSFVAHLGIAVVALAVVASGDGSSRQETVGTGETVISGAVSATLVGIDGSMDGRGSVATARILLGDGAHPVGIVGPELRLFAGQETVTASPANVAGVGQDIQVALLDVDVEAGTATIRVTVTPLLGWLWAGAAVTVVGGIIAAVPGRSRRQPPTAAEPVQERLLVQEMS